MGNTISTSPGGNNELGVVEGDTPIGPWSDPLHKPLVAQGSVPTKARDPAILHLRLNWFSFQN